MYKLQGHSGFVNTVAISSDARYACTGSADSSIMVWDLGPYKGGLLMHTLKGFQGRQGDEGGGHSDQVFSVIIVDQILNSVSRRIIISAGISDFNIKCTYNILNCIISYV
jgi:WD40 repeat protein